MSWWPTDGHARRVLAALAAAALAACVQGPLRTFRSTAQESHRARERTQTYSNLVELSSHDALGPALEYRLDAQLLQAAVDRDLRGVESHDDSLQVRPALELVTSTDTLRWSQRYEVLDNRTRFDPGPDNHLQRTNLLEKLELTPPDLPAFTAWIDRRTVEDDLFVEQDTLETELELQQALPALDYQYAFKTRTDQDHRSDVENERLEHTLRATWREEALDGRLATTLSLFGSLRDTDLRGASAAAPGLEVLPTQGFSAVDTTPEIGTLPQNPALIDTLDTVSAGIDIGGFASGGQEDWNIGVQLPNGFTVDAVHLATVDEVDPLLVRQFVFSVWISDDNAFWTRVTAAATHDYDPVQRRFRLTIPPIAPRFLKVVNSASPAGAPAVLVSEVHLFAPPLGGGVGTIHSEDDVRNANGSVSYRVNERLTLGYDLFLQEADTRTEDVDLRDETRLDQALWGSYSPHAKVDANVRYSRQRTDDPVVRDEDVSTLTGVLSYRPLETLDLDASYTSTDRRIDGRDDLSTDALQGLASAQLLDTLRADVTLQLSRQDDATNQRQIAHVVAGILLVADLTSALELSLGLRDDDADVGGVGSSGIPDPSETRAEMIWLCKPSELFTAQIELDWVDTFAGRGLDQRTRLDWIPFADGALDLNLDYDRVSVASVGDTELERYRAQMRYSMNPHAFLELTYSLEDPRNEANTGVLALSLQFAP